MTEDIVLALGRETLTVAAVISAPLLLTAVVVGLLVTIVQTVTSVQEQTLTFVTKMGAVMIVVVLLMPWLLQTLCKFTIALLSNMGRLGV
jgi:flagellar biosynthetic protein FliQ